MKEVPKMPCFLKGNLNVAQSFGKHMIAGVIRRNLFLFVGEGRDFLGDGNFQLLISV